jgi:hypothetical protein
MGYKKGKYGSVGVAAGPKWSTGVGPGVTSFSFMFAAAGQQGSVRINQELGDGPQGSRHFTIMWSEFWKYSHT